MLTNYQKIVLKGMSLIISILLSNRNATSDRWLKSDQEKAAKQFNDNLKILNVKEE